MKIDAFTYNQICIAILGLGIAIAAYTELRASRKREK